MELNEKLQHLRKQKGLTQADLAKALYVSRTAISKWESGRGYPSIDSLKAIADFFGITFDQLLSSEQLLHIADTVTKQKESLFRDLVFGLLDIGTALLFFLPLFGQKTAQGAESVALLALTDGTPYIRTGYLVAVIVMTLVGVLTLALQNCTCGIWSTNKHRLSVVCNVAALLLFILARQPYVAVFLFLFLCIKSVTLTKWR